MKIPIRYEWIVASILIGFISFYTLDASENRWNSLNNPKDKFSNVSEYLAQGRLPSHITKVEKQGTTYFIAYSSTEDMGLYVPSGLAAYVFDETGKMVHWSADTGIDELFDEQWLKLQKQSSLEELKQFEFQRRIQGEPIDSQP